MINASINRSCAHPSLKKLTLAIPTIKEYMYTNILIIVKKKLIKNITTRWLVLLRLTPYRFSSNAAETTRVEANARAAPARPDSPVAATVKQRPGRSNTGPYTAIFIFFTRLSPIKNNALHFIGAYWSHPTIRQARQLIATVLFALPLPNGEKQDDSTYFLLQRSF
ncbi:MAG: hypothetical protein K0Q73_6668 [Paenibacillus sp.]|nr:hypothetical protein [Paenibacillus sp.]